MLKFNESVYLVTNVDFPQNLERTDTKKWLNEVMDVLFRWILNILMMVMVMLMITVMLILMISIPEIAMLKKRRKRPKD